MAADAVTASQWELLIQEKLALVGENEGLRKRVKQLQEQAAKPSGLRLDKAFMSKKKKDLQEEVVTMKDDFEDLHRRLQGELEQKGALQQNLHLLQSAYQQARQEAEALSKALETSRHALSASSRRSSRHAGWRTRR